MNIESIKNVVKERFGFELSAEQAGELVKKLDAGEKIEGLLKKFGVNLPEGTNLDGLLSGDAISSVAGMLGGKDGENPLAKLGLKP